MNHIKTIRREGGSRVRITVSVNIDRNEPEWREQVQTCKKWKRTWVSPINYYSHKYRSLQLKERAELQHQEALTIVTKEELHQAKLELWQKMKPVMEGKQ